MRIGIVCYFPLEKSYEKSIWSDQLDRVFHTLTLKNHEQKHHRKWWCVCVCVFESFMWLASLVFFVVLRRVKIAKESHNFVRKDELEQVRWYSWEVDRNSLGWGMLRIHGRDTPNLGWYRAYVIPYMGSCAIYFNPGCTCVHVIMIHMFEFEVNKYENPSHTQRSSMIFYTLLHHRKITCFRKLFQLSSCRDCFRQQCSNSIRYVYV